MLTREVAHPSDTMALTRILDTKIDEATDLQVFLNRELGMSPKAEPSLPAGMHTIPMRPG